MASIRKAKKMGTYVPPKKVDKKLLQETQQMVDKVNKRLRNLERGGNYYSYSSKKLFNRLDTKNLDVLQKTRKGKHITSVKLTKQLTNTDLHAVQKASRQFLVSATSTSRGIEKVAEQTKKSMYETLKIAPDSKISKEDVETYYEMLGNSDFDYFNDKIGASAMWSLMEDAKEMDLSENEFISLLNKYITINDEDVRNKAIRLYNKYVI